jgi:hypothetical protein
LEREKKKIFLQQKEYGKHCHIAHTMRSETARRRRRKWRADGRSQRRSSWAMAREKKLRELHPPRHWPSFLVSFLLSPGLFF